MELLEQRQMLAADIELLDNTLKINVRDDDTSVYLRTDPVSHALQYRYALTDEWNSTFEDEGGNHTTLKLDDSFHAAYEEGFKIEVGTGLKPSVDVADAKNSVLILAGIETSGASLEVTSSIDVTIAGDLVTDEGTLIIELKDTTNIFGGSLRHNSSKLTIGPLDPDSNEDADFIADDHLTIHAGEIEFATEQISRKSTKQVFAQDNIHSEIVIQDAVIHGETIMIEAVSEDLSIGAYPAAAYKSDWTPNYGGPDGQKLLAALPGAFFGFLTGGGLPGGVAIREATSILTIDGSTIQAAGDILIESKNETEAKTKAIAAKPGWADKDGSSKGWDVLNTLSVGVALATGVSDLDIQNNSFIQSEFGSVNIVSEGTVAAEVAARTTQNISKVGPANSLGAGGSISLTFSDANITATLDPTSSIIAAENVNFEATGEVINEGDASSVTYYDGYGALVFAVGTDSTNIHASVDGTIAAQGAPLNSQQFEQDAIDTTTNTITIDDHGFVEGQLLTLQSDANPVLDISEDIIGILPGDEVRVHVVDANTIQLYLVQPLELEAPEGDTEAIQTLSTYQTISFNPQLQNLNTGTNSLTLSADKEVLIVGDTPDDDQPIASNPLVTGQAVKYQMEVFVTDAEGNPIDSEPVAGLFDGTTYYAIVDPANPNQIRLAVNERDALEGIAVEMSGPGVGTRHFLTFVHEQKAFSPYTDLDSETGVIHMDTSGIQTGDPLLYDPDPSIRFDRLIDRTSAFNADGRSIDFNAPGTIEPGQSVLDPSVFLLTIPDHGFENGERVRYSTVNQDGEQSAAILVGEHDELIDGQEYVIIRVDQWSIQLANPDTPDVAIELVDASESGIQHLIGVDSGRAVDFEPGGTVQWDVVDTTNNSILFNEAHRLLDGQRVVYQANASVEAQANQSVGGLVSGESYYVIVVSEFEIQLSRSSDANWTRDLFTNYVSVVDGAVDLTFGATGSADSLHRFVAQHTDVEEDWIVSEDHELWTGQSFTYELKAGPAIGGLVEGQTYYAVRLDANRFRVADSLENASLAAGGSEGWVDLTTVGESNTNQAVRYEKFVYPFKADRSSPVVDTVANTIEVINHGMTSGRQVNYQTSGGDPIGGLANAETYEVFVIDADHFQLSPVEGLAYANTAALPGEPIQLSEGATLGTGMHVFRVIPDVEIANRTDPIFVFNPLEIPPVDINADRIRVQGLSVSTGDPVRYLTGGGTAIGGLENGQTYYAIRIEDAAGEPTSWIQLAATEADALAGNKLDFTAAGTGSEHGMEVDSTVSVFDLEIEGLDFGMTYYAVVQGPTSLRLTESPPAAYQAEAQPLDSLIEAGAAPYSLLTTEGITVEGIRISAELEAETAKTAGALVGHHPTLADYVTRPEVAVRHVKNQKLGHAAPTHNSAAGKGEEGHYNWNFLASVAWNAIAEHNVTATVGQSDTHEAILISHHDVVIEAVIDQKIETHALANSMPESGKKFIIATAFAYTDANNRAEAIIGSHARIDAGGELELKSVVEYPRLVDWKDLIPFQGNCVDGSTDSACTPFYTLLKGYSQIAGEEMFGFAELLNTWAQSQAFQAQGGSTLTDVFGNEIGKLDENQFNYAFTFSVGAAAYNNHSNAVIESGAEINQGISLVDLPTVATFEESILKVVADTDLLLVGLAGMIHLNFSIDGFTEAFHKRGSNFNSVGNVFSLTGNKSGTAGLGLSLIEQLMTNHTVAMIESGAIVTTGQEHGEGVVVEARTADKTFNFTQSGVDSEGFGIAASQGATVEDSYTVAIVETGATIESEGALDITAENDALHSVGAGGIAFGDTLGLGLSASTVVMDRQTGAFLGELQEDWDNPTDFIVSRSTNANLYTAEESEISIADLVVESENLGQLTTVSVVGAISNGGNRATGSFSKSQNPVGAGSRNHLGISGDAAVNVVTDETLANIDLSGELSVHEAVEVAARNSTDFLTIAGATAISWNGSGSETAAVAMTAAVAVNDLDLTTVATVGGEAPIAVGDDEGEWHMGSLAIETASHGDVLAVAVALGISQLSKPEFALNAAFSWASNPMIDRSHSYLEPLQHGSYHIEGEHAIDLELTSINDRSINASSGAAAFTFGSAAVGIGIGVSPAVNDITIETLANIQPGVSLWTDVIEIQALQQADIETWSMAGAGEFPSGDFSVSSFGFGPKGLDLELVGSVAINRVTSKSRATIGGDPEQSNTDRVTLHDVGEIRAESKNHSDVKAVAGEGFIAIQSSMAALQISLGLAFGLNEISEDSFSEAMLLGVDILEARGDIKLVSEFAPSLKSVSVAVSLGVIFGSSGFTFASVDGVGAFAVNSVGAIDNKRDHKGKRTAVGIRNESGIRHSFIEVAEDALGILYDVGIDAIATAFEREGDDEYNEISVISQVHDIDLSVALNPTFGSASVGISYTANLIAVDSHATISDSVILEASSVIVDATSAGGIRSVGTSSSLNVSTNTNVSLGFLGTFVINVLEGETKAFIEGGQIELAQIDMTEDQLQIHAVDESSISALAVAGQFGVTVDQAGLAVSVEIPYSTSRNWIDNEIYAGVVAKNDAVREVVESEQAIVELHGNASILALDESLLDSQNDSVAVDVSASAEVGVALNAASAISDNTVTNNVTSEVAGTELTIASGDLSVIAESVPQHAAETFALDIAGSGGYVAVSLGVAVSKATNTIDGDLSASIGRQDAGETSVSVGGAIDVLAELKQHTVNGQPQASAYANAPSIAAALALGIGGSGTGAGSAAESHSHLDVSASIGHAEVRSDDGITIFARDETSLETDTSAISAAVGLGGLSFAVSKSLVVNQNDVSAVISESSVTSDLQDVIVNALGSSELTPHATTVAVTAAIGLSDTTTNIDAIYRGDETCDDEDECGASVHAGITDGSQVNAPLGGVVVDAISDAEVTSTVISGSVGVVAVDVVSQHAWASPAVTSRVEGSTVKAAKFIANSIANDTASTKMVGGDAGGLSINVANLYSEAKPQVKTEIGDHVNIEGITQVIVRSESISDAKALLGPEESGDLQTEINIGLITVSVSDSFATVAPMVDVNIGNASINSGGELLIDAVGGRLMERPEAAVFDADTGIDANPDGLDANTIEFNEEHGLGYGDAIQYVASDTSNASPVGGLTPGEIYRAIPLNATIIRLGSVLVTGTELSVYQSDIPITWHQAVELAQAAGGRLASLSSEAENNDVLSLLPQGQEAWIGGTDRADHGTWIWEIPGSDGAIFWQDGQTFDAYSNWVQGFPNPALVGMDYAAIENSSEHAAGAWITKSGEETLNYYVVATPNSNTVSLLNDELHFKNPHYLYGAQPNDGGEYGEDALAIAASGYWFDTQTMDELPAYLYEDAPGIFKHEPATGDTGWTFRAAVADAKSKERVLAQQLSQSDNEAIKSYMISQGITKAWLGGNDFDQEGTWVWNDSNEVFWKGGLYGNVVNDAYNNFAQATQVIYDAGVIPIGGLVDGETYLVREIDLSENVLKLEHPDELPTAPVRFDGTAVRDDGGGNRVLNIPSHGFIDGQVVTYRAARPLQFNALDVDAGTETVTPHDENATFDISNPDQYNSLLTVGEQVVYAANANNSQWYWLPNNYEETSDQPFWPQGNAIQADHPFENWNPNAPTSIDTQFSAVMVDDGTWNNYVGTETISGYLLERPQFQVSLNESKGNNFNHAIDGWIGVWPATITSEDEWETAKEAIGEDDVYLGGSDADDRSHWYWTDLSPDEESGKEFWDGKSRGDEKNGYQSFWADGEPNDTGLINRETQLLMYARNGKWNDVSESQTHPWLVESKQFTYIPFSGTYEEARAHAQSQGGWLATIRSAEENADALAALEAASTGLLLWIGATNEQSQADWMWVGSETAPNGTPLAEPVETALTYSNWYPQEPNNYNGDENYIQMYADPSYKGEWNDNNGATLLGGYLLERNGDFELIEGSFNWNDAYHDAKARGGQLATINSSSEQSLAESKLGSSSVWIGGTDAGHEGNFNWVEMEGYQNWAPNEPSLKSEHYAHFRSDGTWNDRSATSELTGYLLETDGDYSIVTGSFTWEEAKADAETRGGHLAIIDSAAKQEAAQSVARRFAWIGATANQLIDGLDAGEAYYVGQESGDTYQLSSTANGAPIAISGQNKSSAVNHYLIPADQQPIEGLQEGQSYYVIRESDNLFRLAATLEDWAAGNSIDLSGTDTAGNGYSGTIGAGSTLGTEGMDLTDAGQGRHKLIVDLTEKASGEQSFAFVRKGWRPPFNLELNHGEAKAITTGGGGGLVGVGVPRALAVSEPDVGVSIEVGARLQGENVYVNSRTHANAESFVDNTFVGIVVESGNSTASTQATEKSQIDISGSIHAETDLQIYSSNNDHLTSQAITEGGGAIPLQNSWSRVTHQYTTDVTLDDFARLSAGNQIKVEAHSTFNDEMVSKAKAGGIGGEMKANTAGDDDSKLVDDRKNLGVRIGTKEDRSTTQIDLAASYLNARSITLDAQVMDATASAYSEVRGAGLMTKKATATTRFYDDTKITIGNNSVLHASDDLTISASHQDIDLYSHANFFRKGGGGWFSLRTQTWVDTQSQIDADEDVEIFANRLNLIATHQDVDPQTRLTYGRVEYSDAYDFESTDYTDIPSGSSRNDSGSESKIFNTLNDINFNATVHFKDRRYLHVDEDGLVTNADGVTLADGSLQSGHQYQAGDVIVVDPINYQTTGSQLDSLNYVVNAETVTDDPKYGLVDLSTSRLRGTSTLASVSSVAVVNESLFPMEVRGIDLDPREGNQSGLADSLTLTPDDGSIDTTQWAPGTSTDTEQSLGLFRIENTNPDGSDLIISGDIDAGLGQIHLITLGGDLLAGSAESVETHLTAAAILLDASSGEVIPNPDGNADPFTLEFLERATYPDRVLKRDPDAYWRLGESSGAEAIDQSGNTHDGTYGPDVELNRVGALVGQNTSVRFTGSTNSYVQGADFTPTGLEGQTVSGWFMLDSTEMDWQAIYFMGDPGDGATDYTSGGENRENTFWVGRGGFLHWAVGLQGQAAQYELTTDAGMVIPGRWYHFATVLDASSGQMQLMLNGKVIESRSDLPIGSKVRSESGNWVIANSPSKESGYHGRLDEIAIINRALSQGEVTGLFLALGPAADANWRMNDAASVRMEDQSVNQIDGRYFNIQNALNASPQGLENAAYFDGGRETYVAVAQDARLDGEFAQTVESWIKVDRFEESTPQTIFMKRPTDASAGDSSSTLSLSVDASGTLNLVVPLADGTTTLLNSDAGLIDAGRWHQVVARLDAEEQSLGIYVDGLLAIESKLPAGDDSNTLVIPGGGWRLGNDFAGQSGFRGWMWNVSIRNEALTPFAISTQYALIFRRPNVLQPRNIRAEGDVNVRMKALVNDDREESAVRFNLIETDGDVTLQLLTPELIGERSSSTGDYTYSLESIIAGGDMMITSDDATSLDDAVGLQMHFQLTDRPFSKLDIQIAGSVVAFDDGPRVAGDDLLHATITSEYGPVTLTTSADVKISDRLETGQDSYFVWGGTGQLLASENADTTDLIAGTLWLGSTGGLGMLGDPLRTKVTHLVGKDETGPVHLANEADALTIGNLVVGRGDLEIVNSNQVIVEKTVAVTSGGDLTIAANDQSSSHLTRVTSQIFQRQDRLIYSNWNTGEPNNFNGNQNYLQMYGSAGVEGKWDDVNGDTVLAGYLLESDGQYELIKGTFTWHEAQHDAQSRDGQLATIHSEEDQARAQSKLQGFNVWLGGTDQGHEGTWKWVSLNRYQNWGLNQPDNYNGVEHYAHLRTDGTWNDLSGDSLIDGYLLEISGVYSVVTFDGGIGWLDANRDASQRGGQLATINSRQDQLRAQGVANGKQLWIGATDVQNPGNWLWLESESLVIGATVATSGGDGDILLSGHSGIVVNSDLKLIQFEQPFILNRDQYDNWHDGEPNNSGDGEDYGVMYADGTWNDASGSSVLNGYILELDQQFQFISGSFTWHQASHDAQARGGRLAVLDSETAQKRAAIHNGGTSVWIGATDRSVEGEWKWVVSDNFVNWAESQPDNYLGNENYGMVRPSGEWNDLSGDSVLEGYLLEKNGEFSVVEDSTYTWQQAFVDARQKGGQLAIIVSAEAQEKVEAAISGFNLNLWIGATDAGLEGYWKWIDATTNDFETLVSASGAGDIVLTAGTQYQEGYLRDIYNQYSQDSNAPIRKAFIVDVQASSSLTASSWSRQAEHVIDGSGLSTSGDHAITPDGNMWLTNGTLAEPNDLDPFIEFDIGFVQRLDHLRIWNYNETLSGRPELLDRGIEQADLWIAGEDKIYQRILAGQKFSKAPGSDNVDFSEKIDVGGWDARYIKLDNLKTFAGGDYDLVGLSEVEIYVEEFANESSIIMDDGSRIASDRGNITIFSPADVIISEIETSNDENGGTVLIVSDFDGIGGTYPTYGGSVRGVGDGTHVIAQNAVLLAQGVSGSKRSGIGSTQNPLNTEVSRLAAISNTGNITIENIGDLTLGKIPLDMNQYFSETTVTSVAVLQQAVPVRISQLQNQINQSVTIEQGGVVEISGVAILDRGDIEQTPTTLSVSARGNLSVLPDVPVFNLSGGSIDLHAESQTDTQSLFEVITATMTWEEAYLDAIDRGGRIANLTTEEIANAVGDLATTGQYWIGASDWDGDGNWAWLYPSEGGQALQVPLSDGYSNWAMNNPGGPNSSKHSVINMSTGDSGQPHQWYARPGGDLFGYILEKQPSAILSVESPLFTSGGLGEISLSEGSESSLLIPQPIPPQTCDAYLVVSNSGSMVEGQAFEISLDACLPPVQAITSTISAEGESFGPRYFFSTSELERNESTYADGIESLSAPLSLPRSGLHTIYVRVSYSDEQYTDYQRSIEVSDIPLTQVDVAQVLDDEDSSGRVTLSGDLAGGGELDQHWVVIDWGDDPAPTILNLASGVMDFVSSHHYEGGGRYPVTVTVTDTNAQDFKTQTFWVETVGSNIVDRELYVVGTSESDDVRITKDGDDIVVRIANQSGGQISQHQDSESNLIEHRYDASAFDSIVVHLGSGNDALLVEMNTHHMVTAYGGDQDDHLESRGNQVVFDGGLGDDFLSGGPRADVLIGHAGTNQLHGGGGEDQFLVESISDIVDGGRNHDRFTWSGDPLSFDFSSSMISNVEIVDLSSNPLHTIAIDSRHVPKSIDETYLQVEVGDWAQVDLDGSWSILRADHWDGQYARIYVVGSRVPLIIQAFGGNLGSFEKPAMDLPTRVVITGPSENTNPVNPVDTNNDGLVTGADALLVINDLARVDSELPSNLGERKLSHEAGWRFLDVNADNRVSAGDVLRVINELHRQTNTERISGEAYALPTDRIEPIDGGQEVSGFEVWDDSLSSVVQDQTVEMPNKQSIASRGATLAPDTLELNAIDELFKQASLEKISEFEGDPLGSDLKLMF